MNEIKLVRLSENKEHRNTGDVIFRSYSCPCGRGVIEEEQDYTEGHRDGIAFLKCKFCEDKYFIDFGNSQIHWQVSERAKTTASGCKTQKNKKHERNNDMNRIEEFWYCVAPQEDLPLFKADCIGYEACDNLISVINAYKMARVNSSPEEIINSIILQKPAIISDLRVLVGVSDKRLYLDLTYIVNVYHSSTGRIVAERRENLIKHDTKYFIRQLSISPMRAELSNAISNYFISRGLISILDAFSSLQVEQMKPIFDNLIAPKEIQQQQAKYRGHGAEQAFAKVVTACGLNIVPIGKDVDPMAGYDPNVNLTEMCVVPRDASNRNCHSFDLVVVDSRNQIRVLIQSLIHSSDPGQYGVNKSDETIEIKQHISDYNNRVSSDKYVYLLGSVDGVGFCENPNGTIVKMITAFDDFFQMHTLFKIPVFLQKIGLISNVFGIAFDRDYFEDFAIAHFVDNYLAPAGIQNLTGTDLSMYNKVLPAGKALVIFR